MRVRVLVCLQEINRLTFVEGQKQLLRDGIITVVLLQNLETTAGVERAQDHGIWLEVRGDVSDLHVVYAQLQIERHLLPHDRKLLVVNRQCGSFALLLVICSGSERLAGWIEHSPEKDCTQTQTADPPHVFHDPLLCIAIARVRRQPVPRCCHRPVNKTTSRLYIRRGPKWAPASLFV